MFEVLLLVIGIAWLIFMIKCLVPSIQSVNEIKEQFKGQGYYRWPENWD